MPICAKCGLHACINHQEAPRSCPGRSPELSDAERLYADAEDRKIAVASGHTAYTKGLTRLEETMDFCRRCGYRRIGFAFCSLLSEQMRVIDEIFSYNGFEVQSAICKMGSVSKDFVGIEGSPLPMCNPIAQARALNEAHTDINVIVGLCVGHDSLFIKHSEAPVTVLAVKDKVLGHNPLAALCLANSAYYKDKFFPGAK